MPSLLSRPLAAGVLVSLASLGLVSAAHAATPHAHLSSAFERMLRDWIAEGRPVPPAIIHRWGLDLVDDGSGFTPSPPEGTSPLGVSRIETLALATDHILNDRSQDTCTTCNGGAPLGQAETSIAALGNNLIASWNNSKGLCNGITAVQGYGYSTDGGTTWVDAGDPPALLSGGRYRGDPLTAVNAATGDFYVAGIYDVGGLGPNSGLALLRGHFAAGSFVIDDNREIIMGGTDFLDKPWMAVDPASGNIYMTYSRFVGGSISQIELIRSTTNGVTWDPPVLLNPPGENGNVQDSRPAVGPGGEVYVMWYEYGYPLSHLHIRRSNNGGVSFGPEFTVADFYENAYSGGPGYRRFFGVVSPGIAIDRTNGPHHGRVYVTFTESLNFTDDALGTGALVTETETNNFFASANAFTPGDILQGSIGSSTDVDMYKFTGLRGQTIVLDQDQAAPGTVLNVRLVCAADTTSTATYRYLAATQPFYPTDGTPDLLFTLPADGTYYLRLDRATTTIGTYRFRTGLDTPSPGERAHDHRDQFVTWSDGGSVWSTPHQLNDSPPWSDGEFVEITVDGLGRAHATWHDWRDDTQCGALSYEYIVSSGDGGLTWGPNRRMSDAISFWSNFACGSANQGDYQGITSEGNKVYPCWADSRLGDPDVWSEADVFASTRTCPAPAAGDATSDPVLAFQLGNAGNSGSTFSWRVEDDNGWLLSAVPGTTGSVALSASANQSVLATFHLTPDCTPATLDHIRFITEDLSIPGRKDTCVTTLSCTSVVGVTPGVYALSFAPPRPNPASGSVSLRATLSREGPARLAIYNAAGARVRTLESGGLGAGPHEWSWDGRDQRGNRVSAGVYYARLDAEGRILRRTIQILH